MYKAYVAKLTDVRKHPNADRVQLATVLGNQVVIGLEHTDGEIGVYFPIDGQLSVDFCTRNDLIGHIDSDGVRRGGFFDEKRRVRAQKFRGEKSEGFWCPLSMFEYTNYSFKIGDSFTDLGEHKICNKYYTPQTLRKQSGNRQVSRKKNVYFPEHIETEQLRLHTDDINVGDIVYITEKLHGTSGRYAYVLDDAELPWWKKIINKIYPVFRNKVYTYINGSRRVVLQQNAVGYYGNEQFRFDAVSGLQLHKGEMLYFEIVGFVNNKPIMSQSTAKLKDKTLIKQFGENMVYSYGHEDQYSIFVYRITQVDEDGLVIELPWPQVVKRCVELDVTPVPYLTHFINTDTAITTQIANSFTDGPSTLDSRHIREGVVLRIEKQNGTTIFLKHKSFIFGVLEGYCKEQDEYVDVEEIA